MFFRLYLSYLYYAKNFCKKTSNVQLLQNILLNFFSTKVIFSGINYPLINIRGSVFNVRNNVKQVLTSNIILNVYMCC